MLLENFLMALKVTYIVMAFPVMTLWLLKITTLFYRDVYTMPAENLWK